MQCAVGFVGSVSGRISITNTVASRSTTSIIGQLSSVYAG